MSEAPPTTPKTHDVILTDCRLAPSLIGVVRGDSVRITNRSEPPLFPKVTGESFMEGILSGNSRTVTFGNVGASIIACGFGPFCGRTDVLVTTHSLFGVTDREGHFTVENVPLDDDVVVYAWHPLFQVASMPVKLTAKEPTRRIELVVTPAAVAAKSEETPKEGDPSAGKPTKGDPGKGRPGRADRGKASGALSPHPD
jgi:hypothetical protein